MSNDSRKPRSKTVKNPNFTVQFPQKQVLADIARPRIKQQSLAEHDAEIEADKLNASGGWNSHNYDFFAQFRRQK